MVGADARDLRRGIGEGACGVCHCRHKAIASPPRAKRLLLLLSRGQGPSTNQRGPETVVHYRQSIPANYHNPTPRRITKISRLGADYCYYLQLFGVCSYLQSVERILGPHRVSHIHIIQLPTSSLVSQLLVFVANSQKTETKSAALTSTALGARPYSPSQIDAWAPIEATEFVLSAASRFGIWMPNMSMCNM